MHPDRGSSVLGICESFEMTADDNERPKKRKCDSLHGHSSVTDSESEFQISADQLVE